MLFKQESKKNIKKSIKNVLIQNLSAETLEKIRSLYSSVFILKMLTLQEFRYKYSKFRLGIFWTLLEPVSMAVLLWVVFAVFLKSRDFGLQPYLLFLTLGIIPWWWFATAVNAAPKIIKNNKTHIRLSVLPTSIWVLRANCVALLEFLCAAPVIIVALIITQTLPNIFFSAFILAVILQFILIYGLSLIIAAVSTKLPDIARIVKIAVRALFYLSPILYAFSNVPNAVQNFAIFNPLVGIMNLYRIPFFAVENFSLGSIILSIIISISIFILGKFIFNRYESTILKEVSK